MAQDAIERQAAAWAEELEFVDPVHEAVVARLMVLSRHLSGARASTHATSGLTRASFKILLALRRVGTPYVASPSDLAESLGLSRGALSARLGPLEDDGLVTRAVDRDDRRRVHVRLTAKGRRTFDRHAREESRREAELLGALSPADQRRLADLLRRLVLPLEQTG